MAKIDFKRLKAYSREDVTLRDYQQENKQKIYDTWSETNSVMLQMPTGTGKTRLFVSVIKDIFQYSHNKGTVLKILIMVHRTELIEQISSTLSNGYKLAHGIIQAGEKETREYPIQVASVQTLSRRLDNWTEKEFDFIIVDEAHHIKAESYQKIIKAFPHAKLLGVTATPVRLDGQGFTDTFEELIVSPSVRTFMNNGHLCKYDYYSVPRTSFIQQEINAIRKFSQGDYAESELERICDNGRIRAQVVNTYLEFAKGKKGIVYTINKAHNKNLCEQFIEKGIPAVAIDSDTPKEERELFIEQFRKGEYKVICNVNLFTEGFDCPDIEFIQLARPTKSLALYLQQVGRGLRISDDKEKTLFLDNVGLYNRFGFPSSSRRWIQHFIGKDTEAKSTQIEGDRLFAEQTKTKRNIEEGNEVVHLIQTSREKENFESRKFGLKLLLSLYAVSIYFYLDRVYKEIYINGIGIEPIPETDGLYKPYEDYHIVMKEHTSELKMALKYEDYHVERWYMDGDSKKFDWHPCKNYDEIAAVLNEIFIEKRQNGGRFGLHREYQEFLDNNYTEAELYDLVSDIIQNNEVYHYNSKVLGEGDVPYYKIMMNFWWDASHYNKKKKVPKCIDWLRDAIEAALINKM